MSSATAIFKIKEIHDGILSSGIARAHNVPSSAESRTRHNRGFCLSVRNAAYKSSVFIVILSITTYSM